MIGDMRERILFQKNVVSMDENGNHVSAWTDYYSCAAYANNLSGKEWQEAARYNAENQMYFVVRYCTEIAGLDTEHYRVMFRGEPYNITFVDNVQYKNRTVKIRVVKETKGNVSHTD